MSSWKKAAHILIRKHCVDKRWYQEGTVNVGWNVKMAYASIEFEAVWQRMCRDFYINEAEALTRIPSKEAVEEWYEKERDEPDSVFDMCIQYMQGEFLDGDTYRSATPECLARWGLNSEHSFDVKYGFFGRSGGWLAIRELKGHTFLQEELDDAMPNALWRELCCLIEEVTEAVEGREDELQHLVAHSMRYNIPALVPE